MPVKIEKFGGNRPGSICASANGWTMTLTHEPPAKLYRVHVRTPTGQWKIDEVEKEKACSLLLGFINQQLNLVDFWNGQDYLPF